MTNDEETKPLTVDAKLDLVLARLAALEAKAFDTRPIWERALAEILEVKYEVKKMSKKFDELGRDTYDLRSRVAILEEPPGNNH
jgi:hypothetical protein